jgi:hypothetical protein
VLAAIRKLRKQSTGINTIGRKLGRLELELSSGARTRLLKKTKNEVLEEVLEEMIVKLEAFGSGLRLEALRL